MAVNLNATEAEGRNLAIKVSFTDLDKTYLLSLSNSVLHHKEVRPEAEAMASIALTRSLFVSIIIGEASFKDIVFSDELAIQGSKLDLILFFSLFDKPKGTFNIVVP
jgi:alkyl sulfatase BDS1-like metallo-beta-lactamase superfamily hydrolase